jgi:hypothetical protein
MTAVTGTAADNGTKPKPLTGLARVRESETWRTASVMHDAAYEAERLCNEIYRAVTDAYKPSQDTSTAAETAASPDINAKAQEARRLLYATVNYLSALIGDTGGEPPF